MKYLITLFSIVAATLAMPAFGVLIDFESQQGFYDASTPSSEFSGLVFDRDIQVLPGFRVAAGPGQSGQVARAATPPFGAVPRGGDIGGAFDGFTVSSLSVVVGDSGNDLDIFRLLGFDKLDNLVADSGQVSSRSAITVAIAGSGIARFLLEIGDLPDNDGSSSIDNLSFDIEPVAIPEPATGALVGAGLGLMLLARRRKRG